MADRMSRSCDITGTPPPIIGVSTFNLLSGRTERGRVSEAHLTDTGHYAHGVHQQHGSDHVQLRQHHEHEDAQADRVKTLHHQDLSGDGNAVNIARVLQLISRASIAVNTEGVSR